MNATKQAICISAGRYNKLGGIERYNVEVAQALRRAGHSVSVIVTKIDYDMKDLDGVIELHTNLFFRPLTVLVNAVKVSYLYFRFKNKSPNGLFIVSGLPSFFCDIFVMHSVHRQSVRASNEREPKTIKGFLRRCGRTVYPLNIVIIAIEGFAALFGAKQIITISNKAKGEIIKAYAVREKKIKVVYTGVDSRGFSPNKAMRESLRKREGFAEDDFLFLFSGHEFKRKGLKYAIEALAEVSDRKVKLIVAGKDSPESLREIIKNSHIEDRVFFIGARSDFQDWCAAADAFVFPTLEDIFGVVIIEAMAAGIPVITSGPAFAGACECLENGNDSLFLDDPADVKRIAFYMKQLVGDGDFCSRLGTNARKTAEGLSWDCVAGGVIKAWETRF